MARHVKWYVNVGKWRPTREEWLKLTSSIAEEEIIRINRFHYQEDSKASLVGCALIRKFVSIAINRPSNDLILTRTQYGRPEVCQEYKNRLGASWPKIFDFNVSHSGNYCVLAGIWGTIDSQDKEDCVKSVGVDVTKIVNKNDHELVRFLQLMSKREFTPAEWDTVEQALGDRQKCINFTRLWCLKESFIKSIGLGLSFRLNRICFVPGERLKYNLATEMLRNNIISDTTVLLDGELARDWHFLETALDNEHLVAVGYNLTGCHEIGLIDESPFVELTIDSLLEGLTPISEADEENWSKFSSRSKKSI